MKKSNPQPPQFFAWLASVNTISLIIASQFLARGGNPYLRYTGVSVLMVAGVFIFTPFYLISKHGSIKHGQTYMQARIVVDRGLFSITRHPQYLGYILLACGFAMLSQHWAVVLLAITSTIFFNLQAVNEETYCLAQFGEPYTRYLRRVPRFNVILGAVRQFQSRKK